MTNFLSVFSYGEGVPVDIVIFVVSPVPVSTDAARKSENARQSSVLKDCWLHA